MSTPQIKDEISTLEAIRSIFLRAAEKKKPKTVTGIRFLFRCMLNKRKWQTE